MFLTNDEFKRIRTLQWHTREFGGRLYNTITNETETALFWYDFIRYVFAPRFNSQWGVTNIANFDQTQPVLMTDSLELKLPDLLELTVYYSENKRSPFRFVLRGVKQTYALVVGILVTLTLLIVALFRGKRQAESDRTI